MSARASRALAGVAACLLLAACAREASAPPVASVEAVEAEVPADRQEVIELKRASASEVAETLNDLLDASLRAARSRGCILYKPGTVMPAPTDERRIRFAAGEGNRLVISVPPGSEDDVPRVRELVAHLDIDVDSRGR